MNVTTRIQRVPQRIRHDARRRLLQVTRVEDLTPRLRRIVLAGDELAGFISAGFDDHVKLFIPAPGAERPVMPQMGQGGPVWEGGEPTCAMRDYTPRRYDPERGELTLEFVLHAHGPASDWARAAAPGQWLGVGGPRGSVLIPEDYAAYLLVADETGLPAVARRLEEMQPGVPVFVAVEAENDDDRRHLPTAASCQIAWVYRKGAPSGEPGLLLEAVRGFDLPDADVHAWVAAEIDTARALRQMLIAEKGFDRADIKAAGYWRRGAVGAHERVED